MFGREAPQACRWFAAETAHEVRSLGRSAIVYAVPGEYPFVMWVKRRRLFTPPRDRSVCSEALGETVGRITSVAAPLSSGRGPDSAMMRLVAAATQQQASKTSSVGASLSHHHARVTPQAPQLCGASRQKTSEVKSRDESHKQQPDKLTSK